MDRGQLESKRGRSNAMQSKEYYLIGLIISIVGGVLGLDRYYDGKAVSGFLKLITLGGFGLWPLIDMINGASNLGQASRS